MNVHEFEKILGPKKAARLRQEVAMEDNPDCLYEVLYGNCNEGEFTNDAVSVLCALAFEFYGADIPARHVNRQKK